MYPDRFDLCEAHAVLEWDYNEGGWLRERPANRRHRRSTSVQLARMGFRHRPNLCYRTLTENGREMYHALVELYGLPEADYETEGDDN